MTTYEVTLSKNRRIVTYMEKEMGEYTTIVISDLPFEDNKNAPKNFRIAALSKELANLIDEDGEVLIQISPKPINQRR